MIQTLQKAQQSFLIGLKTIKSQGCAIFPLLTFLCFIFQRLNYNNYLYIYLTTYLQLLSYLLFR